MRRYSALRLAFFLVWLPALSSGQQRGWTLGIRNGDDLADVELVSVQSESLTIYYAGTIQQVTLNAIARMSRSEGGSHVARGAAVGLLFAGGIGLVAGELIDTKNRNSASLDGTTDRTNYKLLLGALGGLGGLAVGSMIGAASGRRADRKFDLAKMSMNEKRELLKSFILNERTELQQQAVDVVILKNGTVLKGSIVEIVPDSIVRLRTPDGNVQVMNMSDVGRITKEVGGQVTSQAQPSVPADSAMLASMESAPGVRKKSIFGVDVGLALPSGDFGSTDQVRGGLVQTGYFVGVHLMNVHDQAPAAWYTSIILSRNGFDATGFPSLGPGANVDAGSYTLLWMMTGIHLVGELSPTSAIYGIAQIGGLFGWTPDVNASSPLGYTRVKSANGSAFAFGVGGGLVINERYTIGCKFIHGEPEYSMSIVGSDPTVFVKGKQSTSILQISAGMKF